MTESQINQILSRLHRIEATIDKIINKDEILRTKQAADFLGIKRDYLYKLVYQGLIPAQKPNGGALYFKRVELEKFVNNPQVAVAKK